jgi:hypothetical protein
VAHMATRISLLWSGILETHMATRSFLLHGIRFLRHRGDEKLFTLVL